MMVHLQYNHRTKFLKVKAKASAATQAQSASQQKNKQPSVIESFELLQPIPQSFKRWKALTNPVCQYLAKDMMPFSTVTKVGFQKYSIHLNLDVCCLIGKPSPNITCQKYTVVPLFFVVKTFSLWIDLTEIKQNN